MNVLEVKNLTKQFDKFTAVDNISFALKQGEILGMLGRNGAGKTTTIQMLLGILAASKGEIIYFGKNLQDNREEILKEINFSSTYISMPWLFTVEELLDLFARIYEIPDKAKRIKKLAREFEIDHLLKKQFSMLSAGEKTRLFMTKSFLNYPKIILLDEPTASLDPDIAIKIREFLLKERKEYNVSMLLTSHNMAEVEEMCDRVMIIQNGKIIAEDTPDNLAKKMDTCVVHLRILDFEKAETYLSANKINFTKEKHVFSFPVSEHEVAHLLMKLANEKITYEEITIDKPDLEDYFLKIVKEGSSELA